MLLIRADGLILATCFSLFQSDFSSLCLSVWFFFLLGNFECGNPENLKSKCIPVMEAQEYIAVSRLRCLSTPGGAWCFPIGLSSPVGVFVFVFLFALWLLY